MIFFFVPRDIEAFLQGRLDFVDIERVDSGSNVIVLVFVEFLRNVFFSLKRISNDLSSDSIEAFQKILRVEFLCC